MATEDTAHTLWFDLQATVRSLFVMLIMMNACTAEEMQPYPKL